MQPLIRKLLVFLVLIVILGLIIYGIKLALPLLGLGPTVEMIIFIIIAVVVLVAVAQYMGVFDGGPPSA